MQNDFCHPRGYFAKKRDEMGVIGLDPNLVQAGVATIRRVLRAARDAGVFVVHTRIVRETDTFNSVRAIHRIVPTTYEVYRGPSDDPPLAPGSWGAEIHDDLAPVAGEYLVTKRTFSAFYGTDLEIVLRRRNVRTVILAGTISYACVLHTAFDAHVRDLDVVIVSDATVSWAAELQGATMRIAELILGAALPAAELIAALPHPKSARPAGLA